MPLHDASRWDDETFIWDFLKVFFAPRISTKSFIATARSTPITMSQYATSTEAITKFSFNFTLTMTQSRQRQKLSQSRLAPKRKFRLTLSPSTVTSRIRGHRKWTTWSCSTCFRICSRMKRSRLTLFTLVTLKSRKCSSYEISRFRIRCWSSVFLIRCVMSRRESCDCKG